jgi:hypothetical protein
MPKQVPPAKPEKTPQETAKEAMKAGIAKYTGESKSYSQQRPQKKVLSRYSR